MQGSGPTAPCSYPLRQGEGELAGIDLVPHSWLTHLLTGYSLQLIATMPPVSSSSM
jgi:hypothetical protein